MNKVTRINIDWYNQLVEDIKDLEFTGIIITKHAIGNRILQDELKFGKPEYGTKKIEGLAKDLDIPKRELWRCIQFAKKCPDGTQFEGQSWRQIRDNLLPEPRVKAEITPLPKGKYSIIYADPPWKYGDTCECGGMQCEGVDKKYSVMSIEELCDLKIIEIVPTNAVLFLWVTSPILPECFDVVIAWGFEYKASFIWDKIKHNRGHYNSVRHELLLICTKGSFLPQNKELHDSVISIERTSKHSEKPEYFRQLIDKMYPQGKRIELFARKKVNGWDSYGDDPGIQEES